MDVTTRFDGFIEKLYANSSLMYVDKSKPLFSVYSDDIASASQELLLAKKFKQGSTIYQSAYNKLKSLDLSQKTLQNIAQSSKAIDVIDVYPPRSGYIVQKNVNDKSFIKKGNLLFQIADLSTLWCKVKVYQADLPFIQKGMKVLLHVDSKEAPFEGTVDYIYPLVDAKTQSVDIRVLINNEDLSLFPNMFATVDFVQNARTMLVLPRSAVLTKGDKHYVFKPISEREFEPVEISAKRLDGQTYEVLSGVSKDEKVIDRVLFMLDSDAITNGLYSSGDDNW